MYCNSSSGVVLATKAKGLQQKQDCSSNSSGSASAACSFIVSTAVRAQRSDVTSSSSGLAVAKVAVSCSSSTKYRCKQWYTTAPL
eukprot:16737-Heterococcus_DN1.PRE.3